MTAPGSAGDGVREQLERLQAVTVAKDLFTGRWFGNACETLGFDEETCDALAVIARETGEEREALVRAVREWADTAEGKDLARGVEAVRYTSRLEFLRIIAQAKAGAGEAVERAAAAAPAGVRKDLLDLASIDFRHAALLDELVMREHARHVEAEGRSREDTAR